MQLRQMFGGGDSTFANLMGRRKGNAKESDAAEDEDKMEDEEETTATEEAEDDAPDTDAEGDENDADAEDDENAEDDEEDMAKAAKSAEFKRGAASERKRISSILNSDEAHGKGESAMHLALNTDLSVKDAKAALSGLKAESRKSNLDDAMKATGKHSAGLDGGRGKSAAGNHGWDKQIERVNAQFGRKK